MGYPIPTAAPDTGEDFQPVADSVMNLLKALGLPMGLGARAGAGGADFLANTSANLLGMRRPNPSAMSDAASSITDPSFKAIGDIGSALNPVPALRSAARGAGWMDAPDEPDTPVLAKRTIGVGGPSPQASLPRLGSRSPVAPDDSEPDSRSAFFDEETTSSPGVSPGAFQQTPPPAAGAAPIDLGALYRARVAGVAKPSSALTPEQENQTKLDMFLNMLGNNRRGSRFLQNAGTAGAGMSKDRNALAAANYLRSATEGATTRDEAYKEVSLTDKSQDNQERARHQKRLEDLQEQANEINRQYREGQIDAKAAELEVRRIHAQMAELRAANNPLEAQIRTILKYGPEGMKPEDALRMALSKGKSDEDQQIDDAWKASVARAAATGLPAPSRDQIVAIRKYGDKISRGHPDYVQTLRAMPGGDSKQNREKLDSLLKTRGLRVVD